MDNLGRVYEEMKIQASELGDKVKDLIHEANVRRIIIKDDHGNTFVEIPLGVATLGAILAPVLAAVGAIATALSKFTVVVERVDRSGAAPAMPADPPVHATAPQGATEEQVNMSNTVAQRIDDRGTKTEDLAGFGENDSKGG